MDMTLTDIWMNPVDGSTMRLIREGNFTMGSTASDIEAAIRMDRDGEQFPLLNEAPQFIAFVPGFYIGISVGGDLMMPELPPFRWTHSQRGARRMAFCKWRAMSRSGAPTVWFPLAHPAATSDMSAVLSGRNCANRLIGRQSRIL
jgi:hypothetical protein